MFKINSIVYSLMLLTLIACDSSSPVEKSEHNKILNTYQPRLASGPDRVGNGGDILFCQNENSEHHLTLLDSYEVRRKGLVINFGDGSNWSKIVGDTLSKWESVGHKRISQYKEWLASFEEETFWNNNLIGDIADHGNIILPRGCEPRQVAMQRAESDLLPGQSRYEIDNLYWDLMSEEEKAVLVLHELVLREAVNKAQHKTSIQTRYLVGVLLSSEPKIETYFSAFVNAEFPYAELGYGLFVENIDPKKECLYKADVIPGCQKWRDRIGLSSEGYPTKLIRVSRVFEVIDLPGFYCEPSELDIENYTKSTHNQKSYSFTFDKEGYPKEIESGIECRSSNLRISFHWGQEEKRRRWDLSASDKSDEFTSIKSFSISDKLRLSLSRSGTYLIEDENKDAGVVVGGLTFAYFFDFVELGMVPGFEFGPQNQTSYHKDYLEYIKINGNTLRDIIWVEAKACSFGETLYIKTASESWHYDYFFETWQEGPGC